MDTYKIIVWHNDSVNGTHQQVLMGGKTMAKVLRDFGKYLERPACMRSFTDKNLIQLHHIDKGVISTLSAIA